MAWHDTHWNLRDDRCRHQKHILNKILWHLLFNSFKVTPCFTVKLLSNIIMKYYETTRTFLNQFVISELGVIIIFYAYLNCANIINTISTDTFHLTQNWQMIQKSMDVCNPWSSIQCHYVEIGIRNSTLYVLRMIIRMKGYHILLPS